MAATKPPGVDVNPVTNKKAAGPPAPVKKPPKKTGDTSPFGAPPKVPIATNKSKRQQFAAWAQKAGIDGTTINNIWYWSHHLPNVDPYLWSSVLLKESGADHLNPNGTLKNNGQAVGIGQIALSWVGHSIPWAKDKKFTADNDPQTGIANYGVNLRMSATLWSVAVSNVGWQKAYTDPKFGYNPNDPKKDEAWADIQKTYGTRPTGNPPPTPSEGPANTTPGTETGNNPAPVPFKDPYVTGMSKQGKLTLTDDPNRAIQFDGRPVTRSSFLSTQDGLASLFISYTGQRPNKRQVLNYITKSWSPYQLQNLLAGGKHFVNSPIYKEYNTNWADDPTIKNILGPKAKIPVDLARKAIINHWDSTTVAAELRKSPNYVNSNEFKGNVATLLNVHDSIQGSATPEDMVAVKDAALAGWTGDQYAAYLRQQPTYTHSTEYQSKALSFLGALGMVTGNQTILAPGVNAGPGEVQPKTQGVLPTDPRIKGTPTIATPLAGLGVTFSNA